ISRVAITAVNDAPVLMAASTHDLNSVNEDELGGNPGTPVSTLIAGAVTDMDNTAAQGIAVVAVDSQGGGTWQYSITGGATWLPLAQATGQARVLTTTALVRLVPIRDYYTTGSAVGRPSITYLAWDRSDGATDG